MPCLINLNLLPAKAIATGKLKDFALPKDSEFSEASKLESRLKDRTVEGPAYTQTWVKSWLCHLLVPLGKSLNLP